MEQNIYCNQDEFDENLSINLKKIFFTLWSRKWLMLLVGFTIFLVLVFSTFTSTKIYTVNADLYINKTNNSNMTEVNPYVIDEMNGLSISSIADKTMMNELEIMQSPLVIDKVITENNLKAQKLFGFITTAKTGQYITTEKFLKQKKLKIENKKNTNIVSISYKSKDKEQAYNIINSLISNYIALQKEINNEKSKSDKKILETEYNKAKSNLNSKMNSAKGMPPTAISGTGNLSAMSIFSKSAQQAMSNIQGQYASGVKSEIAIKEEAEKVSALARKLEWAKLVDEMSDSSKVIILKAPRMLKDYEQTSPKLLTNILLGIVLGIIGGLSSCVIAETVDKKLSYSKISDNIIYNLDKALLNFKVNLYNNYDKKIGFVFLDDIPNDILEKLKDFSDAKIVIADISREFKQNISNIEKAVLFVKIKQTDFQKYKLVKSMIEDSKIEIINEVLL